MTVGDTKNSGAVALVVGGVLGMTAHLFPRPTADGGIRIRLEDACFLLSGQIELWSRWPTLESDDRVRIARLLRFRPVEVANRTVLSRWVDALVPDRLPGFRAVGDGELLLDLGRAPLEYVDECVVSLLHEREVHDRHATNVAGTGDYATLLYAPKSDLAWSQTVDVRYRLDLTDQVVAEPPIAVNAAVEADVIEVPVAQLREIAIRLDCAFDEQHRTQCLDRIFSHLETNDAKESRDTWSLRAGPTQIFHAPTGVGKTVLLELLACWCAERGRVATLVLPTNAMVLKTAHSIDRSLRALGVEGEVVPLTSPHSAQKVAETTIRGMGSDGLGAWAFERLAYGCALTSAAAAEQSVDAWQPGSEPCGGLRKVGADGRISGSRCVCPWKPRCGKFRNTRRACSAAVVVTSHMNWLVGAVQVPVELDEYVEPNIRVEELLLRRSHVVVIDEIDAFQAAMIDRSALGLLLAQRRRPSPPAPLRRLDAELNDAGGRVDASVEHHVRATTAQARYLAENYTAHLADGAFRRNRARGGRSHPLRERWLLPRKWDAWLAATLFGIADGEQPRREHYEALQWLFSTDDGPAEIPEWLRPVRAALIQVTSITSGDDAFEPAWEKIYTALQGSPYQDNRLAQDELRVEVTDRLIRRAYLESLRGLLLNFVYAAPQLQASGVPVAREIAEALGQYAAWRAAPYGPLGRALFAFTEHVDPERSEDTSLRVSAFGGDPHGYVTGLGDVTALAHLGRSRVVLGFSATSYFPQAPHHHVFARPTWWVCDENSGGIRVQASPISDKEKEFLRVSGTSGPERRDVLITLGEHLWKKRLAPALSNLSADPQSAHRARLLLATTSYQGARDLAEGISNAGVPTEQIVLAVRPGDTGPRRTGRWIELPADQLESFGHEVDGAVLIAPLARAQRGLNIVDRHGRSLIGSIWLVVRPLPIMDEPAEILAHVHARARASITATEDPAAALDLVRQVAGRHFEELFTTLPYFRSLPAETQVAITAETLNGLIQLAGRARRGGDIGEIHLVDYAFLDTNGKSDLPSLIRKLRKTWARDGDLELIHSLYGATINEIFDFADSRRNDDDRA